MSYCVNCGVELDPSLKECPLCNTPVINPRELNISENHTGRQPVSPFPEKKGQVEVVKRKDMAILLTTVVLATAVVCGLLNALVFSAVPWSLAIIGGCILFWAMMVPVVIYTRQSVYVSILLDGMAMAVYLYLLTYLTGSRDWLWGLGLPVTALVVVLAEVFAALLNLLPRSFLATALYAFTSLALLCLGLEIFIDRFLHGEVLLGWSAIVATVCLIVDATIITLLSRKRLRNAVRRRLHF